MNKFIKILTAVGAVTLALSTPAAAQGYGLGGDGFVRAQSQPSDDGARAERRRERRGGQGDMMMERTQTDRSGRFDEAGEGRRGGRMRERVVIEDGFERRVRRGPVVIERRVVRRGPRVRTVCTTRIQERVTRRGVLIRRPVEVCRQVVRRFGRRF